MAITKAAELDFATMVMNHHAKDAVIDRITMKLMRSFQRGSPEVREEAVKTLDSLDYFFQELNYIIASEAKLNQG